MNETEHSDLPRLFSDYENLLKVLQLLESGADLHDDTYEAQFLDALEDVILAGEDSFKQDLLSHCTGNVAGRSVVNVKFRLNLATLVIKCVPDYAVKILDSIGIPSDVSEMEDAWTHHLKFYQQVFRTLDPDIAKLLCEGNEFWNKILFPACQLKKNELSKYVRQDIQETFASYVGYLLYISDSEYSGSKRERPIRNQLKDNLNQLHQTIGLEIFDYIKVIVLKSMSSKEILYPFPKHQSEYKKYSATGYNFIIDWVSENLMDEDIRTNPGIEWLSEPEEIPPDILYTILEVQSMKKSGFPIDSPASKMRLCSAWVKSQDINMLKSQVFNDSCEDFRLVLHALALLTEERNFSAFFIALNQSNTDVQRKLFGAIQSFMSKIFKHYKEEPELVPNKTIRVVLQFAKKCYGSKVFRNLPQSDLPVLLNIASQRYSGDDFVKCDILSVIRIVLRQNGLVYSNNTEIVSKLITLTLDQSLSLNLRDSALRCLASDLEQEYESEQDLGIPLKKDIMIDKIGMTVKKILQNKEHSLKATAIAITSHLVSSLKIDQELKLQLLSLSFPSRNEDSLSYCDLYYDDARVEMVKLSARYRDWLQDSQEKELEEVRLKMVNFVIGSLRHDSFWEVKREVVNFLENVFVESLAKETFEQRVIYLEKYNFFTGIVLGFKDYESPVRESYFEFLKNQKNNLKESLNVVVVIKDTNDASNENKERNAVKRKHHTELGFDEEEADDILDVNDKTLVNMLEKRQTNNVESRSTDTNNRVDIRVSLSDFSNFCSSLTDPRVPEDPTRNLNSIMEDILASSSGLGQIDLVDCY